MNKIFLFFAVSCSCPPVRETSLPRLPPGQGGKLQTKMLGSRGRMGLMDRRNSFISHFFFYLPDCTFRGLSWFRVLVYSALRLLLAFFLQATALFGATGCLPPEGTNRSLQTIYISCVSFHPFFFSHRVNLFDPMKKEDNGRRKAVFSKQALDNKFYTAASDAYLCSHCRIRAMNNYHIQGQPVC